MLSLLRSLLRYTSSSVSVLGLIFGSGIGAFVSIRLRAASRVGIEEGLGAGGELERHKMWERRKKGRRRRKRRASRLSFMSIVEETEARDVGVGV